ncbi:MAG: DUF2807 domain-containing protein [Robiginitalea sp.]
MKRLLVMLPLALFLLEGCGKNGPDCIQSSGDLVREELALPTFQNITVFENVRLVLRYGTEQQVIVETGKNIRSDVTARVEEGTLELRDQNNCNFFRAYGRTTFYVTTPDLQVLRSSTGWPIQSEGILPFTNLRLVSESFNNPEAETTDGSFDLEVDTERLSVVANGIAYFKLRGQTEALSITVAAGDSRIEAEKLLAGTVQLNHRGSNDILINPAQRIGGVIQGYGDVLSFNRPPEVEVEETFRGRLIFID